MSLSFVSPLMGKQRLIASTLGETIARSCYVLSEMYHGNESSGRAEKMGVTKKARPSCWASSGDEEEMGDKRRELTSSSRPYTSSK